MRRSKWKKAHFLKVLCIERQQELGSEMIATSERLHCSADERKVKSHLELCVIRELYKCNDVFRLRLCPECL
jgi:hypothetical protein